MRTQIGIVFALLVGMMLAGCAGKGKEAAPAPSEEDPFALGQGVTNVLQGIILSGDGLPLEAVYVTLPALPDVNATTNPLGEYRFENLEPRDYIVTAQKEGWI